MVHIMHNDLRELYGLEDLWAEGIELQWQAELSSGLLPWMHLA